MNQKEILALTKAFTKILTTAETNGHKNASVALIAPRAKELSRFAQVQATQYAHLAKAEVFHHLGVTATNAVHAQHARFFSWKNSNAQPPMTQNVENVKQVKK